MKLYILLFLLISFTLGAKEIQRQQILMGTFVKISLEEKDIKEIQKGFKLIKQIEKSLSSYDKTALLYRLNKERNISADTFLKEALIQSINFNKLSKGYFDISIGSVTKKLYKFGEKESIPSKEALTMAKTDINGIYINKNQISLDDNITLDLGGMGKGFAVDKVANYYREQNISHGIIALSGDIQALHPRTVFIDSPFTGKPFIKLQTLQSNISISTSGTYRRYVKTKEHHHLINPKIKSQGTSFVSITLITKRNNTLIDAMATAIGVMPEREALDFLINHPHIGYILVRPNGNVLYGNLEKLSKVMWF